MTSDVLLLITAAIWGFAFVAQRLGMNHMGPFTFNAIRFTLGGLSLLPLLLFQRKHQLVPTPDKPSSWFLPGLLTGIVLFIAASLQQMGLIETTAAKAGFITGLYVILVPLLALIWGEKTHPAHWAGALLAVAGLYFLSIQSGVNVSPYDLIVLAGAFVWAGHVHLIDRFGGVMGPIRLSVVQFLICGLLSGLAALIFESPSMAAITNSVIPLLYGAFLSVGLAYTLQVVAQRQADPAHAAILLSLEGAFAALGGWWILKEGLSIRALAGCALMLVGTLVSQLWGSHKSKLKTVQPSG